MDNDFFVKINNINANMEDLLNAGDKVAGIDLKVDDIISKHNTVLETKVLIDEIKIDIDAKNNEIKTLNVEVLSLSTGSGPSIDYNSSTGKLTIGVPKGDDGRQGDTGEAFKVDKVEVLSNRNVYDDAPMGFSFLAVDTAKIYFKQSNTSADWSIGSDFGKGADGIDGGNGTNGTDGLNGTDGTDGINGALSCDISQGNLVIADNTNMAIVNPVVFDTIVIGNNSNLKLI